MDSELQLGPFRLVRPVARGGMGVVVRAVHERHDVDVAVKVMTARKAQKRHVREAFRDEVRAVARLNHPNIVQVFDSGTIDESVAGRTDDLLVAGSPYLVMELAESPLSKIDHGQLSWTHVRTVLTQMLDGLAHSHARGLIHRDLKPANVLFVGTGASGRIVLSDFGIAQAMHDYEPDHEDPDVVTGTPRYMAPEQISGTVREHGPWTDLYALGCLAFWLTTGAPPYDGDDLQVVLRNHLHAPTPELKPDLEVPSGFEQWVYRLLAREPEGRYRRAADAVCELARLNEHRSPSAVIDFETTAGTDGGDDRPTTTVVDEAETTRVLYDGDIATPGASPGTRARSDDNTGPQIPTDWRAVDTPGRSIDLVGAGLGLYGLRQIPMVGRDRERDELWEVMSDASETGRPHAAILSGPAGVGKTRLADWLAERGHEVGAVDVLRASHSPIPSPADGLSRMFADFLGCTGLALPEIIERLRQLGDDGGREPLTLATLLAPGADPDFEDHEMSLSVDSVEQRFAVWRHLLAEHARRRPLLMILDDVQWGAEAVQFARYLLEDDNDGSLPVTVLMTRRDNPTAAEVETLQHLDDLRDFALVRDIGLEPLSDRDHRRLIHNLLGLEQDVARQVVRRTAGNPLFAVQLVGDWGERGVLEVRDGGFDLAEGEDAPLPDSIHEVLVRRLSTLLGGDVRREVDDRLRSLELGASLGRQVDFEEWETACRIAGVDPSRSVLENMALQSLVEFGDRDWQFVHGALRETIKRIADESNRLQGHHLACATALEQLYGTDRDRLAARRARHLLAAGELERALHPLCRAIHHYGVTSQLEAGRRVARRHREVRDRLGIPDEDRRAVRERLARSLLHLSESRYADSVELLEDCERVGRVRRWDEELARTRRALEITERIAAPRVRVNGMVDLGEIAQNQGRFDEARRYYRQALKVAEQNGLDKTMIARLNLGWLLLEQGDFAEARGYLETARESAVDADRSGFVSVVHVGLMGCAAGCGDWEQFDRHWSRVEGLGDEPSLIDRDLAWAMELTGRRCLEAGCDERGARVLEAALEQWRALERGEKIEEVRADLRSLSGGDCSTESEGGKPDTARS